ncbi:MAG TPA: TraR/DksA family transcriptional regulator [Acidobacteriota bacterium]|jgi:DnaK suppressor protein|nr:TraR/DksA family transcriptional regulator [Acidobacteriota bacterium]HRV07952.1 TraR/DksA family transcriptional regulator [Acidobacteriota bacterium]
MSETYYSPEDLGYFKDKLLAARAAVLKRVQSSENSGREVNEVQGARDTGDQAQDSYTKDLLFGLSQQDRLLLREIEAALGRIDDGSFGICMATGEPIERRRLEALPWARFSLKAQERMER